MKILFVLECANRPTNGTSATCNRFAHELRKKGHEVVTIGCEAGKNGVAPHYYIEVPAYEFPFFEPLIQKEGFNFCRCSPEYLLEAIQWADLVHVLLPMKFGNVARLMAEVYGKPVTTAYHLQPQNITSAIHCGRSRWLNNKIYKGFLNYFYRAVKQVHCPSQMIADQMKCHHYDHNQCHVISNGVTKFFYRVDAKRPEKYNDKFIVVMSGRLASEKRQDLIIKAVAHSKYNEKIQIILCGQGPNERRYRKLAAKLHLANPIKMKFCDQDTLRNILSYTDLYVHASDFEIEGISCLEAISCGAVPVISDSKLSAANSFAITDESIFKHGSWESLRDRIEWMYEHEEERKELSKRYQLKGKEYALPIMVDKLEAMFFLAVEEKQKGQDLPTLYPSKVDEKKKRKLFENLLKNGFISELPESLR